MVGKVAIVTGASKGIGAAAVKALVAEGAAIAVNYSSGREGAERVVSEITRDGGKAIAIQADVSKAADVKIDTEGNRESGFVSNAAGKLSAASTPLAPRFGKPEEIAPVMVSLASEDAARPTGERISASGGLH